MKRLVEVTQYVTITVDETKFTPAWMEEFRQQFYSFEFIEEHLEHLAQLFARGMIHEFSSFIEGYGPPREMGIKIEAGDVSAEVMPGEMP